MDRFFFWNRNAPGNLILWPLIIWVSLCKQRRLQTYNQILWFGCKPITHERQRDVSIQLLLCSRIAWNTERAQCKRLRILKGSRGRVTDSNGHLILQQEMFKCQEMGINHQMCSALCLKWASVTCSLQLRSVGIAMPIYQMRKQTSEKWSDLLLFTQRTSSRAQIWPLTCLDSTFHSSYLTSPSSTPIQGIPPTKEIDMQWFIPQDKLNQVSRREAQ